MKVNVHKFSPFISFSRNTRFNSLLFSKTMVIGRVLTLGKVEQTCKLCGERLHCFEFDKLQMLVMGDNASRERYN